MKVSWRVTVTDGKRHQTDQQIRKVETFDFPATVRPIQAHHEAVLRLYAEPMPGEPDESFTPPVVTNRWFPSPRWTKRDVSTQRLYTRAQWFALWIDVVPTCIPRMGQLFNVVSTCIANGKQYFIAQSTDGKQPQDYFLFVPDSDKPLGVSHSMKFLQTVAWRHYNLIG